MMNQQQVSRPIVDTHFHLWEYVPQTYPWLAEAGHGQLRKDHLPLDYRKVADSCGIVASVHIEASWRADEPVAESRWLTELALQSGVGDALVANVPLHAVEAPRLLEQQTAFDKVVGIRNILTWHPDPAKSRVPAPDRMADPVFRRNFALLEEHRLSFDILMSPWQAADVHRLACDHPGITIAINHCGSPFDRDDEGMARWRNGLALLASAPNVVIKISDPVAYDPDWSVESLREVILTVIDIFGPRRAMFGTDYPVAGLHIGFARWVEIFTNTIAAMSDDEQTALLSGTAARTYRLDV